VPRLYNELRPHSSLQYRTPMEFAQQAASFYVDGVGEEASLDCTLGLRHEVKEVIAAR
jgi:hypothetical protein